MDPLKKQKSYKSLYLSPIIGGATAGATWVCVTYPLDTLKTRLQAAQGFREAGGFHGVYKGFLTAATGSALLSGIFFVSYESCKRFFTPLVTPQYVPIVHMFAASFCEILACLVRVPTEVVKQRQQIYTGTKQSNALTILADAYRNEGLRSGVYRGFTLTVLRDMPFSFIEFPTWEILKATFKKHNNGEINSFQSGLCGSVAGAFATVVTNPLDVAKTRVTLAKRKIHLYSGYKLGLMAVLTEIYSKSGFRGLFAGVVPRTTMAMCGEFVFFGMYDETKRYFEEYIGER